MMWETEEERLALLAEALAEQATRSFEAPKPKPPNDGPARPQRPGLPRRILERKKPKPSQCELAIARYLAKFDGFTEEARAETAISIEREAKRSVRKVHAVILPDELDEKALEWLKAQGFR